ncbi:MAG TPA: hypothetical protein PLM14_08285 [Candidatus Hydrogenedentes bacterium]|nr:hypothetical protein [Candidatus Hydrogenedentota bacterium]HQE82985.1 hypothetical protein [Candidatus Hydrogenedentota bacterium]HQH53879.1 hypothetical protein [Candidatus Hydrogenedentota bacterium]HQM47896.1 hypothetical protein [Candidatus Hydrogenedentota bacterium]
MAKKKADSIEYIGWTFWFVVFVLIAIPAIYVSFQLVTERTTFLVPISMGGISAAVGAGLLSWAVNVVVQYRVKKRQLAARKKAKKR